MKETLEEEKVRESLQRQESQARKRRKKQQAEEFALAGEVDELKEANGYLHSENQKLIDCASACVEDVIKFKREAEDARDELEASEEREKDRVKIIEGMKKKIKELTNEVETLITVKRELSLRLTEQCAEEERKGKEESKK